MFKKNVKKKFKKKKLKFLRKKNQKEIFDKKKKKF